MSERPAMIVTGASSGIGRALAERAARAGYDVFAVGRRIDRLRDLKGAVAEAPGMLEFAALDVRTPSAPKEIVRETLARFGRIDVLVNCAGGVAVGEIAEQTDEQVREQLDTHVIAPLALTREALPSLRNAKGQIFFFGSGVARIPVGGLGAYPPAKAAVRSLARIVRAEVRGDGVAVTYVDPGAVATEFMTRAGFSGPPKVLSASANTVAKAIFAAVRTRRNVVNAVGWQTTFVAIGEFFPNLTDFVLRLAPGIVGGGPAGSAPPVRSTPHVAPTSAPHVATTNAESSEAAASDAPTPAAEAPAPQPMPAPPALAPPPPPLDPNSPEFALQALAPRMRKLNLGNAFVHALLVEGRELDLGDVAMRWAGMPNKNERNLTREVLEALADGGFLEREGDDRYRVLRGVAHA